MIRSFLEYVAEGRDPGQSRIIKYADDVINIVSKIKSEDDSYVESRELEYDDSNKFDLVIQVKKDADPNLEKDSHFHRLSWEKINFDRYGFAIDANTRIDKMDLMIPEIIVTLIVDPNREPDLYDELRYRLIDIISHEINHTDQIGWNRKPFKVRPSSNSDRNGAKNSFEYFLLPDEIESMVKGMYMRSKNEDVEIDKIFDKYLYPFLESGKITTDQYLTVLKAWVEHTLENYPDAKLSTYREKINKIVDQI